MSNRAIPGHPILVALSLAIAIVSAPASILSSQATEPRSSRACPVTQAIHATPPRDPSADPFGDGPWYVNSDRSIWVGVGEWTSGSKGNKALWIRPAGTNLTVTGHRADDRSGAPLTIDTPCCYRTGFQASRVYFPSPGCWEVSATAGESRFTFIVKVLEPRS